MVRGGGASEGAACFTGADDDRDWGVRLVESPAWQLLDLLRSVFERLALKESKYSTALTTNLCKRYTSNLFNNSYLYT